MILKNIIKIFDEELKLKTQEKWDNSGLQIGDINNDIKNIMLTLDLDKEAVEIAINHNINLIITHHPLIFSPMKSIDFNTYAGQLIRDLIISSVNVYSLHTNFDIAEYGVNYELANKLEIRNFEILHIINEDGSGYGGISNINPINILEFSEIVKKSLNCSSIRLFCNNDKKVVKKVAFCGGSGSDFIEDAINSGADVYVTGDIKYHQAQYALNNNLFIIDAGHYYTEYHSLKNMQKVLNKIEGLNIILLEKNTVREIII